ncbi:hypothetical protein HJD18_01290 [Thermoleophilia bacterium SCSIO 60948]|nr:hypothetical protein HJD18_01290 [Thermoleophilia bacterium SCSIO 60948]
MSWLLGSLIALLVFPAVSQAAPQPFELDLPNADLTLNDGVQTLESSDPNGSTFTGTVDDVTGAITVPQANVDIAQFASTSDPAFPIIASPQTDFTGSYDEETGDLSLSGTVDVITPFGGGAQCRFPDLELNFESAPGEYYEGFPFTDGLDGDGGIVAGWESINAPIAEGGAPQAQCNQIGIAAGAEPTPGPGELFLSQGEPPEPTSPFELDLPNADLTLNDGVQTLESSDPNGSTFTGTIGDDTGTITVPQANVDIAQFASTSDPAFPIIASPQTDFTGSYDEETGDLSLSGTVDVITPFGGGAQCRFPDLELNFESAPGEYYEGFPFTDGLDGDGGIVAGWESINAPIAEGGAPQAQCNQIGIAAGAEPTPGPGELFLSQGEPVPPVTPSLRVSSTPASAKVKQGKAKTFKVKVRAKDATGPTQAKVCATVPGGKKGLKLNGKKCRNVGGVYDEAKTLKFKVKAKPKTKPKKYTLKFRATANGYKAGQDTSKLKVLKKKKK